MKAIFCEQTGRYVTTPRVQLIHHDCLSGAVNEVHSVVSTREADLLNQIITDLSHNLSTIQVKC